MQTTLLGLGIAIILALVAALVGPHFVDWNQYRSVFEANASRLAGMPVRVNGKIDARLLPTPSVVLRDIEAGEPNGAPLIKAGMVAVELSLGPLMRGEWRAAELRLVKPEFGLEIDNSGRLAWPGGAPTINPDALSIERLAVEDGRAILTDRASASRRVLDGLWFNGDVRSLIGPYKGEGGFTAEGERYGYRLSTGRFGDDGIRVKLSVDPDYPLTIEAEGMLRFENGAPRFEGGLTLARPVGVASAGRSGRTEPWRATSRVKGTPAGALFDHVEFQYGPDERAIKLTATAELKFGKTPQLDAVVSARQVDLDRALGLPEATQRLPVAVARALADLFGDALRPPIPVRLGIGIDNVTLAGAGVAGVRGDLASDGDAWNLQTLEFRAPGFTQVRASGRLALGAQGTTFTGPVAVEATDPKALLAWLEGRDAPTAATGPLRASGEVTLGTERVAIERLKAEFDRKAIEGRLAYAWAAPGRKALLDAQITAPELDVDGTLAFVRAALAGASVDMPSEVTLALDVGLATMAGIEAKGVKAKLKLDANGLALERASVADLGGASVDLSGRIDGLAGEPRGTLTLTLDARTLDGVTAILARFAPWAAETLRLAAPRVTPTKLRTTLTVEPRGGGEGGAKAKLIVSGKAGAVRLNVIAAVSGDVSMPAAADITVDGRIDADNGGALATLLGLDRSIAVDQSPGAMEVVAAGRLGGEMQLDGWLRVGGLNLSAKGALRPSGADNLGSLDVSLAAADVRTPRAPGQPPGQATPVTIRTRLALARDTVTFDDLTGAVAGSQIRGKLVVTPGEPMRVDGRIEADTIDAAAVIAAAAGAPAKSAAKSAGKSAGPGSTAAWPAEPFVRGAFAGLTGQVEIKAARANFASGFSVRQLKGLLRFGEEVSFENVEASIADGRFTGRIALRNVAEGVAARFNVALTNADMAALGPGDTRPPMTGRVTLRIEAEGSGLSPAALIGGMRGTGTVTVEQAQLAGLDPRAFAVVTRAVDQGLAIDATKIKDAIMSGLDMGRLIVPRADGGFAIAAGQIRWGNVVATGDGADLAIGGSLDVSEWLLDARLTLTGPAEGTAPATRPDIFVSLRGAPTAPERNVDASALVGWLMLRAVERESRRLEALQGDRTEAPNAPNPEGANANAANANAANPEPANPNAAPRTTPTAARTAPAEEPAERPRPRVVPAPPAPGPRSAAVPPATVIEGVQDLPAPTEIRPAPAKRNKTGKSGNGSGSAAKQPAPVRPPADVPPPLLGRSLLEPLFGPQR